MAVGLGEESGSIVLVKVANSDWVSVAAGIANSGDAPPRWSQPGISEATQATKPIIKIPTASNRRRLRRSSGSGVGFIKAISGFPARIFESGSAGVSVGLSNPVAREGKLCEALLKASANDPAVA